jgi:hypothetical protein
MKRSKKLDNRLVSETLKLEGKRTQMNAANAHHFLRCLQVTLATNDELLKNFLVGVLSHKSKGK